MDIHTSAWQLEAESPGNHRPALMDLLHKLRRLDQSSPEFPDHLTNLLYEHGHRDYVANLRDPDSEWLVEYLDNVSLPCYLP